MEKKQLALTILFAVVLLVVTSAPLSGQQGSNYDPWLDFNGDGRVDASDLQALGQTYGGTGDSTKDVNVTNFPLDENGNIQVKPRTVQKVVIMGTYLKTPQGLVPLLIDKDSPIVCSMEQVHPTESSPHYFAIPLPPSGFTFYDQRFEYNATSLTSYEIRGQAIAQIRFVFSIMFQVPATAELNATLYLEKIDEAGDISIIRSYYDTWSYIYTHPSGPSTYEREFANASIFNFETPYVVNQDERLAIRLVVSGRSSTDQTRIVHYLHYLQSDFLLAIPIVIGIDT